MSKSRARPAPARNATRVVSAKRTTTTGVRTKRFELRALGLVEADMRFAYEVLTHTEASAPFRWRGATPSRDEFSSELFAGLLAGFVVIAKSTGTPRGITLLTSPDLRDGHAFLSVAAAPSSIGTGRLIEAMIATIEFAFGEWPFFKLYADVDSEALRQFGSLIRRGARVEGVFGGHIFRAGERLDVMRLAIYRSDWAERAPEWVRRAEVEIRRSPAR